MIWRQGLGRGNTATGVDALHTNITGLNNVAIGYDALVALGSGNNNIAIGAKAGQWTKSGSNDIYIGQFGNGGGTESNVTRIGAGQTKTFIAGIAKTPPSAARWLSNPTASSVASSARYKQDIRSLDDKADKLAALRPVSFRDKVDSQTTHYGLIAEEVDTVMPELVVRDDENRPESVQYQELIPLLLQQWQAQRAETAREREAVAQLQALAARQQDEIKRQMTELAELRRTVATRMAMRGDQ